MAEKIQIIEESTYPDFNLELTRANWQISKSTLWSILKHQDKLLAAAENHPTDRKSAKPGKYGKVEIELCQWIESCNQKGIAISSKDILKKAKEICPNMRCSAGWLGNFKRRFNVIFDKESSSYITVKSQFKGDNEESEINLEQKEIKREKF